MKKIKYLIPLMIVPMLAGCGSVKISADFLDQNANIYSTGTMKQLATIDVENDYIDYRSSLVLEIHKDNEYVYKSLVNGKEFFKLTEDAHAKALISHENQYVVFEIYNDESVLIGAYAFDCFGNEIFKSLEPLDFFNVNCISDEYTYWSPTKEVPYFMVETIKEGQYKTQYFARIGESLKPFDKSEIIPYNLESLDEYGLKGYQYAFHKDYYNYSVQVYKNGELEGLIKTHINDVNSAHMTLLDGCILYENISKVEPEDVSENTYRGLGDEFFNIEQYTIDLKSMKETKIKKPEYYFTFPDEIKNKKGIIEYSSALAAPLSKDKVAEPVVLTGIIDKNFNFTETPFQIDPSSLHKVGNNYYNTDNYCLYDSKLNLIGIKNKNFKFYGLIESDYFVFENESGLLAIFDSNLDQITGFDYEDINPDYYSNDCVLVRDVYDSIWFLNLKDKTHTATSFFGSLSYGFYLELIDDGFNVVYKQKVQTSFSTEELFGNVADTYLSSTDQWIYSYSITSGTKTTFYVNAIEGLTH